jgi:hypothetical protein
MKLTNKSKNLISFFLKYNCILPIKHTNYLNNILTKFYTEIKNGVSYIIKQKHLLGNSFYNLKIHKNIYKIPKPISFSLDSFPKNVIEHIDENITTSLTYKFNIYDRKITILFLIEDENDIKLYNKYVDYMLVWLYIANVYSSKDCACDLIIYIYCTSLLKILPSSNIEILNENNVNTAFTRSCSKNSEIVIFRKEEWFKVFIHETFHNFGLDFSHLNTTFYNNKILNIFPVKSEVNLYESYTEFWARIINALFCSFINMKNKNNIDEFLLNTEFFINIERIFAFFQMIKVLKFMGLSYNDLYKSTKIAEFNRTNLYKENTNVLSYYVITSILLNNYSDFLIWCNSNNKLIINFKKTNNNLNSFCHFIETMYKTKHMLDNIKCTELILFNMKPTNKIKYLLNNLRMTICELG